MTRGIEYRSLHKDTLMRHTLSYSSETGRLKEEQSKKVVNILNKSTKESMCLFLKTTRKM